MTKSDIEELLIRAICKVQAESGREVVPVQPGTRPHDDIPDFDSLNGVEVTVEALEELRLEKVKFNNVLFDGQNAITISDAADRLLAYMADAK